jgi:uncharacterized protein (TIGR03437 family)
LIEISATGSGPQDGGNSFLIITTGTPDVTVAVAPASAKLNAGLLTQQFSAQVANTQNTAVRWSISPPIGSISASGLYTSPAAIGAPTLVTVTANSFADTAKKATAALTVSPGSGPVISDVVNGATFRPGVVAGSWVTIRGTNLTNGASQDWSSADFSSGRLPTTLAGVQVNMGGQPAAIYYVSPGQLNVQAPATAGGDTTVRVISNGAPSNIFHVDGVQHAPGLFAYAGGSLLYPAAVFPNGAIVGDPSVVPGTRKAVAGDRIQLYATGIDPSPAGTVITSATSAAETVTVLIGSTPATVEFAGLVAVGEFQINIVVPNLPDGAYPITVQAGGQSSPASVVLPVTH